MARYRNYNVYVSNLLSFDLYHARGKRVYLMIRAATVGSAYINYDAGADSTEGDELPLGTRMELYGSFTPSNERINIAGSTAALQRVNISEAYED